MQTHDSTTLPKARKCLAELGDGRVRAPGWQARHTVPYMLKDSDQDGTAEAISFPELARTSVKASQIGRMHRIVPRKLTVAASFLLTYEWKWGLLVDGGMNPHWHTSVLKRWLCSFIHACGYDAYPLAGQAWLDNESTGLPVLVCALSTGFINQNFKALTKLHVPILAVVEDYQEGYHADAEYMYTCTNGIVVGRSNGKPGTWYDENLFCEYRDGPVGDGWYIHTIASLGPQRVVVFDTYDSANAVKNEPVRVRVDEARGPTNNRRSLTTPLDLEVPAVDPVIEHPGYEPKAFDPLPDMTFHRTMYSVACGGAILMFAMALLVATFGTEVPLILLLAGCSAITVCAGWLWKATIPDPLGDMCPDYYLVDTDAADFLSWLRGTHAFAHRGYRLPPGFYHIDEDRVVRVCPSHPDCNYTNMIAIAEEYCASKSWNPKTGVRKLIRLFGPVPEKFFTAKDSDMNIKEPELPPDLVRTIPVPVKINPDEPKVRIASLDYNHDDFTLPVPDASSIAATATTRVFQKIREAPCLDRLEGFWKEVVHGRKIMHNPEPPDFSTYSGAKRRLYENTYEKLCSAKVAHYSSFLKIECLPSASIRAGKAIRAIEPNSKSFNVSTFNFFHTFERTLLATLDQHGLPLFAKGSNMDRRCEVIQQKLQHYRYVYSCDFKNFDGHHKGRAYLDEIEFYLRLGLDRYFEYGLKESRLDGLYEASQPKRHSGDLFTGSGNCLVVASMLYWKGCDHTIYCDGDDTLVFTNDANLIGVLCDRADRAGHILTVEEPERGPFGVIVPFCQHKFNGDKYWPSHSRICNKLFNIPYTSQADLEKRIYGKLCAVAAYRSAGVLDFPEFICPQDDDIAWRYEGTRHLVREPTNDPAPAGPIVALVQTLVEKCRPSPSNGFGLVLSGADRIVKRAVHQFVSSDPTFREQECNDENFGTRFRAWVTPVSRSVTFSSQFGSANFVDCTKRTKSTTSKSSSSLPTTLSPMVYSPSHTTTTQVKDLQPTRKPCSSKQEHDKSESTRQSRSGYPRKSSGPPRPADSRLERTATCSTRTSGSPPQMPFNPSASTSSTTRPSTRPKQQKPKPRASPPSASTTSVEHQQVHLKAQRPTHTVSTSTRGKRSRSAGPRKVTPREQSDGGMAQPSSPPPASPPSPRIVSSRRTGKEDSSRNSSEPPGTLDRPPSRGSRARQRQNKRQERSQSN